MSELTYVFKNSDDLEDSLVIELIDSEYVDAWKETLIQVCTELNFCWSFYRHGNIADYLDIDTTTYEFKYHIKPTMESLLAEMIVAYEFLCTVEQEARAVLNVTLSGLRNISRDVRTLTQHHLNECHRHFTTLELLEANKDLCRGNEHQREHYFYIHEINRIVHALENYTMGKLARHKKYPEKYYSISFTNANDNAFLKSDDCHKVWQYVKRLEPGTFDIFTNDYDYDVWLQEDIVGKDQKRAWLDHDDLTKDDITGNLHLTPSLMLDVNKLHKRIYDDEGFRTASKASGKTVDRLPLGRIISQLDSQFLYSTNPDFNRTYIEEIILDGETIYRLSDKTANEQDPS